MASDNTLETQSLLSSRRYSSSLHRRPVSRNLCVLSGCRWLISRPVLASVFIHAVVSASNAIVVISVFESEHASPHMFTTMIYIYMFIAIVTLFSPVSGLLADVRCGRYRVIVASIRLMFGGSCVLFLIAFLELFQHLIANLYKHVHHILQPVEFVLAGVGVLLFMLSLAGYQANYIQFGLDQLLEAPSVSLALFIHWITWAERLGTFAIQLVYTVYVCENSSKNIIILPLALAVMVMLLFLTMLICLRKCGFSAEPQHHNPYKMVVKVLNFARNHKYPLQRSAFTYCDDEEPSRIDFAKERYGGPFTTEQVEDVKTFFRIVLVLLATSPVLILRIPSSIFVTSTFVMHTGVGLTSTTQTCSVQLLEKVSLHSLVALVFIPLFIWTVFALLRPHALSIFSRLLFAVVVYLCGVISMLCIDLVGHMTADERGNANNTSCLFTVHYNRFPQPTLGLHWSVLLIPGLLLGIGPPLVMATVFEFISAQSPSSMRGLLVGVFFTIQAFFQLISGAALIPFAYTPLWDSRSMREHPPVTNCGFGYLSFTCVVALIGLILLTVAIKKYKQRERDDRPYDQRFAVDVYSRYIEQDLENNVK